MHISSKHKCNFNNNSKLKGDYEVIKEAKIGDIIQPNHGCRYASFLDEALLGLCNSDETKAMHIKILAPSGSKISRNKEHYGEALFPPDAKYKILSKKISPSGLITAFIEYLP